MCSPVYTSMFVLASEHAGGYIIYYILSDIIRTSK